MVKFIDIDPKDVNSLGQSSSSSAILAAFMERNKKVSKLDLTDKDKTPMHFRAALGAYAKSHEMPIEVFMKHGDVYLTRTDLTNTNKPIIDKS